MGQAPETDVFAAQPRESQAMSRRYCGDNLKILREHVTDAPFDPIDLG
jgi:hypothetical protein